MEEILRAGFAELGIPVPPGAIEALRTYYELLEERNQVTNLTAITGEEDVARFHFLDCAALLHYKDLSGLRVLDVGSGAGFPGLVLSILCPAVDLTLVDSQQKRVLFQQDVVSALGLENVRCIHGRVEDLPELRGQFDLVISRAVAHLKILTELCMPTLKLEGVFVSMKGPDPTEEMREAKRACHVLGGRAVRQEKYTIPGTNVTHSLIMVRKEAPSPAKYPRRYSNIKKNPL